MRFRERHRRRNALVRDRRIDGSAAGGRARTLQIHRDHSHGARDPGPRRRRGGGAEDVRVRLKGDRRKARPARRRPGVEAAGLRGGRSQAGGHGVPAVLRAAGRRRRRHHPQPAVRRPAGADGKPRPVRLADGRPGRPPAQRPRGTAALDQPGDLHAPHGHARRRSGRSGDQGRRQGGDVLRRRQPRSGSVRAPGSAGPVASGKPPDRLRNRPPRLPRPAHRPHRDRRHAARGPDPDDRL